MKYWLEERSNNNRSSKLSTNMFFLALNNVWRDMFQPNCAGTKRIRAQGQCSACHDCDSGKKRCAIYPACKDAKVKLAHFRKDNMSEATKRHENRGTTFKIDFASRRLE